MYSVQDKKNAISVEWSKPADPNGVILNYNISWKKVKNKNDDKDTPDSISSPVGTTNRNIDIGNNILEPYTVYNVSVKARTSAGYGDAEEISCETAADLPNAVPQDLKAVDLSPYTARVSWTGIDRLNWQDESIKYVVSYKLKSGESPLKDITVKGSHHVILTDLASNSSYVVYVSAKNTVGVGNKSENAIFITKPNINECEDASLHNCAEDFDCVNTLGSFECVCSGLESKGSCNKDVQRHRVNLRLNEDYKDQYAVNTSTEFQDMKLRIETAMEKVYENNGNFLGVKIISLRNGSVIADLDLSFKREDTSGVSKLLAAVRNNSFGNFDVDPDAVTVIMIGTCPNENCPGNSTCKILTSNTISCPCNENFYFDGVKCSENIVIKVEITLEKPFVAALENESSPEFIELKENVTAELTEIFKDTPNFQEVQVLGFRNGSTVVDFVVIYRDDPVSNKKVVVAETIKKELQNSKIRNLQLKVGSGVKLQGTPGPPTDLKHTDVAENRIDISWSEPVGAEFFVIDGYIISYKTVSEPESAYKTMNVTSAVLNVVLSDLKSDTFYNITAHGYNDEGDGDKVNIQVRTEDTSSPVITIVVAIIVVVFVLLLIIIVVLFIRLRKRRKRSHRYLTSRQPRDTQVPGRIILTGLQSGYDSKEPKDKDASGYEEQISIT